MQDRARLLAPAMMLSVLFAFQSAISEIRDELTVEKERRVKETGLSKFIKWMFCSDMFGAADPLQRKAWQNLLGRLDEQTAQGSRNHPSSNNAMTTPKTMNKRVLKIDGSFFYEKKRTSNFRLAHESNHNQAVRLESVKCQNQKFGMRSDVVLKNGQSVKI